jgi:hypothetical protein
MKLFSSLIHHFVISIQSNDLHVSSQLLDRRTEETVREGFIVQYKAHPIIPADAAQIGGTRFERGIGAFG